MKRYLHILIFGFSLLFSCNQNKPKPFQKLLVGEWILDSISGSFKKWDKDFVYITDEGSFWKFTYSSDRYLIDSCFTVSGNTVLKDNHQNYQVQLIDSFNMKLADNSGNTFFYRLQDKEIDSSYKDDLRSFISQDSLHQKVNGWWKLTKATFRPIKLINYRDEINDFTVHLNKNGTATIFIDHLVDSTIQYSWEAQPNKLSFGRYCILGAESPIFYLDKNKMVTTFDKWKMDTLTFERCSPLTK